jgi:hypothetical protein
VKLRSNVLGVQALEQRPDRVAVARGDAVDSGDEDWEQEGALERRRLDDLDSFEQLGDESLVGDRPGVASECREGGSDKKSNRSAAGRLTYAGRPA